MALPLQHFLEGREQDAVVPPPSVVTPAAALPVASGATTATNSGPWRVAVNLEGTEQAGQSSVAVQIVIVMTLLTLAPSLLMMMTSFTRIVIVLGFVRTALGVPSAPANQIVVGLSLFLSLFIMGSLRAFGVMLALPSFGGRGLPMPIRAALAMLLGGLLANIVPTGGTGFSGGAGALALASAHEVVLGLAMGFVVRTVLSAAELAGRIIAGEIGLVAAPGFDVPVPAQEPLPSFIGLFAGMMFFLLHAHEGVLAAFARSFELAPAGAGAFSAAAGGTLVFAVSQLLELALRMAAPFIALNFVVTLGFAILGRAVPKMNVFIVSYALRSLLGLLLLAGAGALIAQYLSGAFERMPWQMLELVRHQ
ncbi:MAG: flagellar biosynthetic protein FliR [Verrucomicrobiota bacterium]